MTAEEGTEGGHGQPGVPERPAPPFPAGQPAAQRPVWARTGPSATTQPSGEFAESQPPTLEGDGYTATKQQLQNRLARIEGQVRGISKMVDEDRYCIDVLTQINSIQAALDKVALGLLDGHARHCLMGGHGGPTDPDDQVDELMGAVGRMLSR